MLRVVVKNIGGNKGTANVKASIAGDPYSFLIPQQITLDIGESGEVGFIVSISQSITEINVTIYDTLGDLCDEKIVTIGALPGLPSYLQIDSITFGPQILEVGRSGTLTIDFSHRGWVNCPPRDLVVEVEVRVTDGPVTITTSTKAVALVKDDVSGSAVFEIEPLREGTANFTIEIYVEGEKMDERTAWVQIILSWWDRYGLLTLATGAAIFLIVIGLSAYYSRRSKQTVPPSL
jgi:hypothetical protein